jgi:mannosyltransferase OCH1-like enzyme
LNHHLDDYNTYNIPFNIKRTSENAPREISGVPLIIYQSWHMNSVPKNMKNAINKLIAMNPEFDYYLYSDEKSREFICENYSEEVVAAFDSLKPGAYKSDLWRYCILYKTGGVYLDIKYYSLYPINEMIKKTPVIFVNDLPWACSESFTPYGIYNALLASPPKHSIFINCINEIVRNTKMKIYGASPLHITGPCLLSNVMIKYDKYVEDKDKIFKNIKWKLHKNRKNFETILYDDKRAFVIYKKYRAEQKAFQKTEHYGPLWDKNEVYYD